MTHAPHRILVGVDFSPESAAAIAHAETVARAADAEVVLLHACTVPSAAVVSDLTPAPLEDYRARLEADLEADRAELDAVSAELAGRGLRVSQLLTEGFPDTAITQIGHEIGADLTVVGSHGRTGLRWLLLGSVAQRVVRLADSDVLVARGAAPTDGYHRVVVATDFSAIAARGLEAALELAGDGAIVDVVHFWHLAPPLGFYEPIRVASLESWRGPLEREIGEAGERLIAAHRRPGVELRFEARFEPVMPGLLDLLQDGGYDLAALGSHGRHGFRRLVLGSVAEEIARRAPCSVLVAHGGGVATAPALAMPMGEPRASGEAA